LADILADVFVSYFTKEINNIFTFLILLADVLADLTETKNKKGPFKAFVFCVIHCGPLVLSNSLRRQRRSVSGDRCRRWLSADTCVIFH